MKRKSQQGVALVITLILLSVITFLAVTFLVLSRRGAAQADALTQQTRAKQGAETGVQMSLAEIIARMMATTNGFEFGLVVSTNYESPGYDPSGLTTAITNVSYYYAVNGQPTTNLVRGKDLLQVLNNMVVLPRVPVFVTTNAAFPPEFRYYLDLNRNGRPETNGAVVPVNNLGQPILDTNNLPLTNIVVGDPEWVGILDHPDQRPSSSNQFIARYAFIALPIGNSLDLNAIHNAAKQRDLGTNYEEGFIRDQGVGSWELNLAGFLHSLNGNYWNYDTNAYDIRLGFSSLGAAFDDANSLLRHRYNGSYFNLRPLRALYPATFSQFLSDYIDTYSTGPLLTSLFPPTGQDPDLTDIAGNRPWSGADNPNQYFSTQDLFNSPYLPAFSNRLAVAGAATSSFDRYTYYRMLSQLGLGSAPDATNKINLNYVNVEGVSATNMIPWTALQFFTNAADRLIKSQPDFAFAGLSVTNIPLYPVNRYTPAVHRMLQLAANIYDASTDKSTNVLPFNFDYPSVFRPTFGVSGTNIFISGYVEVGGSNNAYQVPPLALPEDASSVTSNTVNIYGVPWVIGARKGFPNFNEVSMQCIVQISRKLQITKPNLTAPSTAWHTNIQYMLGISNNVAVETWNSYRTNYPRAVEIRAANNLRMFLTNDSGTVLATNWSTNFIQTVAAGAWPGFLGPQSSNSFVLPMYVKDSFLPDSIYRNNNTFLPTTAVSPLQFETTTGYPQPHFGLNITNRLQFAMVDPASGRVLDYVHLDGIISRRDLLEEMAGRTNDDFGPAGVWNTNRLGGSVGTGTPIYGTLWQIQASQQPPPFWNGTNRTPLTSEDWTDADVSKQQQGYSTVAVAAQAFSDFMLKVTNRNSKLSMQVPFTPTRRLSVYQSWQANDPLVHYTIGDLTGQGDLAPPENEQVQYWKLTATNDTNLVLGNLSKVNNRYIPWGATGNPNGGAPDYNNNIGLKDPLVNSSDDWQFPSNKFPGIGWLGRVHRGTPWQTIYMKAGQVDREQWTNWTGNTVLESFSPGTIVADADIAQPTNDWAIFDLFTTAVNDNATRGQLSVNQTNEAAWHAVLDGVIVVTNTNNTYAPIVIDPTLHGGALQLIINGPNGINSQRTNYPGHVFTHLGDILSVSNLTLTSPFLDTTQTNISDAAYERLPQQIMSLLRVGTPRYVIYAYGQSLKPAERSQFTGALGISPSFFGMITNYQVTGEMVTRTVVRFEPAGTNSGIGQAINPNFVPRVPGLFPGFQPPPPRAIIESFSILPPE